MNNPTDEPRFDPDAPLDGVDASVLAGLRSLYGTGDPAPDLVDRVLFALDQRHLDAELAAISEQFLADSQARGAESPRTITFGSTGLIVTVVLPTADDRHLDGWLEPAMRVRIELVSGDRRLDTFSDEGGRFAFDEVPTGLGHLEIHPGDPALLPRRVVTQQIMY